MYPVSQTKASLHARISTLETENAALRYSHFGVLSPAATRYELARLSGPHDLLILDIRKMHSLNDVLGFTATTNLIGTITRVRHATWRNQDLAGQIGGDEFVYAVATSDGIGLLRRLLAACAAATQCLAPAQRARLAAQTNGLISGICVAAVLMPNVQHDFLAATDQGVDHANKLKAGSETGERSTSGVRGTRLAVLGAR